jgi:cytochrome P450 family 135
VLTSRISAGVAVAGAGMAAKCTLAFMDDGLPPGPSLPRLAQVARWLTRPVAFATAQRARFGDAFTVHIEPHPWVMLADPDAIRDIFTAGPEAAHAGEANEILRPILGSHSILLLDERAHLRQRRLMLPPFHGERMLRYRNVMREATERAIATWPVGEPFAMRPHTQAITLEVILRAVFGVESDAAAERLRVPLDRMLRWFGDPRVVGVVSALGPEHPVVSRTLGRMLAPVDEALYALIAERRAAPDLAEREDILSLLLLATDEAGEPMTDAELRDELMTLLTAGHETTATALAWAVERLVRAPRALDRVAADPAYRDAVVKETLRLRPVLPIVLRRLTCDARIGGREYAAGTTLAPCILLVHRREDLYPEPHAFRPERFLDSAPGTYTWIPFGGGVRRCLGAAFATLEMKIVIATILSRARLRAPRAKGEKARFRGVTMLPSRGGEAVVEARLP